MRRLRAAYPEDFCQLVWAADMVAEGRIDQAQSSIALSDAHVPRDGRVSQVAVHQWELETLFSLYALFLTPEQQPRRLSCSRYEALFPLVNDLRKIENAEYSMFSRPQDIFLEMGRIARRQFPWQRGFHNVPQHFRSAYIFNHGECEAYFTERFGVSPAAFTLTGFALLSQFVKRPRMSRKTSFDVVGLTDETLRRVLSLISLPVNRIHSTAAGMVRDDGPIAYQRSFLRNSPILEFGPGFMAPLPPLVEARTTSGIYYDVVQGGSRINNEVGNRFEQYCRELIGASLPGLKVHPPYRYGPKKRQVDTPDLLIEHRGEVRVIVECKAKRMSHRERFGGGELDGSGMDELAKGIVQIWRFVSDHRLGRTKPHTLAHGAVGMLLTLDEWPGLANAFLGAALERAGATADRLGDIEQADRIPIALSQIDDLEQTLQRVDEERFLRGVELLSLKEKAGWFLRETLRDEGLLEREPRPYALRNRIGEQLPWWDVLDENTVRVRTL